MIKSSLLKTRLRLLQCYDRDRPLHHVSQNGSLQSPCSLWEQWSIGKAGGIYILARVIPAVPLMVAHAQMGGRGTLSTGETSVCSEYDTCRYQKVKISRLPGLAISDRLSCKQTWHRNPLFVSTNIYSFLTEYRVLTKLSRLFNSCTCYCYALG